MNEPRNNTRRHCAPCCLFPALLVTLSFVGGRMAASAQQEPTSPEVSRAGGLAATAWATFRGNARNTGLSKSKKTALAEPWTRETPNDGMYHSPALGEDGTLYIGSDTLLALDGNTGKKKWEYNTGHSFAGSIAIGLNGLLYVGNKHAVQAIDSATGKKRWSVAAYDITTNPTVSADGTLYIGGGEDKQLLALNGETGKRKWAFPTKRYISSAPAIAADGTIYAASDKVYALNPADGKVKWSFGMEGHDISSSPILDDAGTLYTGTMARDGGTVIALNGATGELK